MDEKSLKEQFRKEKEFNDYVEKIFPTKKLPKSVKKEEINTDYNLIFGDHFLFQIIDYTLDDCDMMSYPKMGMFCSYGTADQTYSVDYVEQIRNYEWNFKYTNGGSYYPHSEVKSYVKWGSTICVFGIWKQNPTWKEMKIAYKHTFYFRDDRRNKIRKLLTMNN